MSASHRDRRVRLYGYSESGGGGFISPLYTFRAEWWASVAQTSARIVTTATQASQRSHALVELSDEAETAEGDLLVDGDDRYEVKGATRQVRAGAIVLECERLSDQQYTDFVPTYDEVGNVTAFTYGPGVVES